MPVVAKLIFVTFDFEKVITSFLDAQTTGHETKLDVDLACELGVAAKHSDQPWVNENDDSSNFESTEISLQDIIELNEQFEQKFEPALALFFDYFIAGRSFSGRRFAKDAGFYAYLTLTEIEEMTALLNAHYEESFNLLDKGAFCKVDFKNEMVEVMESLLVILKQANGFALFITAS